MLLHTDVILVQGYFWNQFPKPILLSESKFTIPYRLLNYQKAAISWRFLHMVVIYNSNPVYSYWQCFIFFEYTSRKLNKNVFKYFSIKMGYLYVYLINSKVFSNFCQNFIYKYHHYSVIMYFPLSAYALIPSFS